MILQWILTEFWNDLHAFMGFRLHLSNLKLSVEIKFTKSINLMQNKTLKVTSYYHSFYTNCIHFIFNLLLKWYMYIKYDSINLWSQFNLDESLNQYHIIIKPMFDEISVDLSERESPTVYFVSFS